MNFIKDSCQSLMLMYEFRPIRHHLSNALLKKFIMTNSWTKQKVLIRFMENLV